MRILSPAPDEAVPIEVIDLYDPDRYRTNCQHSAWQTLRRLAPVWRHERPGQPVFWSVTRHSDCELVLKDYGTFSSAAGTMLDSAGAADPAGGQTISLMDPPEHTLIRMSAMRAFSHGAVRKHANAIHAQVRRLIQPCLEGPQDFAALMRRLPMAVSGLLIGIPDEHWDPIAYWMTVGIAPRSPEFSAIGRPDQIVRRAHHEVFARFSELIAHKRRYPGTDLISYLLELRRDGRPLGDTELLLNCYSFMAGANSTTPHVATQTMLALAERPVLWAWLADNPDRVPALVEEGVRWTATPHHLVRRTVRDTVLGGAALPAGAWVCAWLASAQRDEAVIERPYDFDPRRPAGQGIGFGVGPHYCIGAPLTRFALRTLFEEALALFDHVEITGAVTHMTSNWVNGVMTMPMLAMARRRADMTR